MFNSFNSFFKSLQWNIHVSFCVSNMAYLVSILCNSMDVTETAISFQCEMHIKNCKRPVQTNVKIFGETNL